MCQASKAIFTERLDLLPSEDERDLERYVADLLLTGDFYFQYGVPYSDELVNAIDFHSSGVLYYSLFLRDTKTMVGYVGLLPDEDDPGRGEIEYYIFRDHRRQGYAKEALAALLDRFFSGALTGTRGERAQAETHSDNDASRRLLERLGFTKEASGMRLSLDEDGGIDAKRSIGLCKYRLDTKAVSSPPGAREESAR